MQQVLTFRTVPVTCSFLGSSETLLQTLHTLLPISFDVKCDFTRLFLDLTLAALEWFLFLRRWRMLSGSPLSA